MLEFETIDWSWVAIGVALAVLVLTRVGPSKRLSLVQGETKSYRLISRTVVNHNTRIFRFALPDGIKELGLPVGKHILVSAEIGGRPISRAYTPVEVGVGYFDLMIKVYFPTEKFPAGGLMSQYLDKLTPGAEVSMRGPSGSLEYIGGAEFLIRGERKRYQKVCMIAGGTGITPMLQLCRAASKEGAIEMHLLFANQTPEDILLKDEVEAAGFDTVAYTVDRASSDWMGMVGFVDELKVKSTFPAAADDVIVLCCGPPAMVEYACRPVLRSLGYVHSHVF